MPPLLSVRHQSLTIQMKHLHYRRRSFHAAACLHQRDQEQPTRSKQIEPCEQTPSPGARLPSELNSQLSRAFTCSTSPSIRDGFRCFSTMFSIVNAQPSRVWRFSLFFPPNTKYFWGANCTTVLLCANQISDTGLASRVLTTVHALKLWSQHSIDLSMQSNSFSPPNLRRQRLLTAESTGLLIPAERSAIPYHSFLYMLQQRQDLAHRYQLVTPPTTTRHLRKQPSPNILRGSGMAARARSLPQPSATSYRESSRLRLFLAARMKSQPLGVATDLASGLKTKGMGKWTSLRQSSMNSSSCRSKQWSFLVRGSKQWRNGLTPLEKEFQLKNSVEFRSCSLNSFSGATLNLEALQIYRYFEWDYSLRNSPLRLPNFIASTGNYTGTDLFDLSRQFSRSSVSLQGQLSLPCPGLNLQISQFCRARTRSLRSSMNIYCSQSRQKTRTSLLTISDYSLHCGPSSSRNLICTPSRTSLLLQRFYTAIQLSATSSDKCLGKTGLPLTQSESISQNRATALWYLAGVQSRKKVVSCRQTYCKSQTRVTVALRRLSLASYSKAEDQSLDSIRRQSRYSSQRLYSALLNMDFFSRTRQQASSFGSAYSGSSIQIVSQSQYWHQLHRRLMLRQVNFGIDSKCR